MLIINSLHHLTRGSISTTIIVASAARLSQTYEHTGQRSCGDIGNRDAWSTQQIKDVDRLVFILYFAMFLILAERELREITYI